MTHSPSNSEQKRYPSQAVEPDLTGACDHPELRRLFDDYLRMYCSRDDRLTEYFSEDFSGFTGGGDFLVNDKDRWVAITRQDFDQVREPIRVELHDLAVQSLADGIAVATSFFTIHLPIEDHILSRETARLVLIFRKEAAGWKISHSSISIPYHLVGEGEVYPLKELVSRNQELEEMIAQRTAQLCAANEQLRQANSELAREIAEREQADDETRRAKAAAEEAHRAKSQFLAVMSHEIRTPLNALVGFSTLARKAEDQEKLDQYHTIIEQSARSLMELTNNILDMSKIEAGRMEVEAVPFNLRQLLGGVEDQYRPLAGRKMLALRLEIAEEVPAWILGDPIRLQQILANLLSNAVKFTENGEVCCRVSLSGPEAATAARLIRFEVEDTGIGIPENWQSELFRPFHQLDPSVTRKFGGTGLGLAIVQSLATMMGGRIAVRSCEGAGSCFTVNLPFFEAAAVCEELSTEAVPQAGSVLVVEDNAYNRRLLEDILTAAGHRVTLAEDGGQALEHMRRQRFDIVLLDIRMPDIDGIEVAKRIRRLERSSSTPPVPIIAVTADADAATKKACLAAGINAVLTKPVNPRQLSGVITAHCGGAPAQPYGSELGLNPQTRSDLGENAERVRQYREMLSQDIADELRCLQAALESADRVALGRAAHALKGLCGHLASPEPAKLSARLQRDAPFAPADQLRSAVEQLRGVCRFEPAQKDQP